MYVTLRRYAGVGARMYEIVARRVEEGLVPTLKAQPGFRCYCALVGEDGNGMSVTVFDERGQAARANEQVRGWGRANLHDHLMRFLGQNGAAFPTATRLFAAAYRPARRRKKNLLDVWRYSLGVGEPLPVVPLVAISYLL